MGRGDQATHPIRTKSHGIDRPARAWPGTWTPRLPTRTAALDSWNAVGNAAEKLGPSCDNAGPRVPYHVVRLLRRGLFFLTAYSMTVASCTTQGDDDDAAQLSPATGGSSGSKRSTGGRSSKTVDAGRDAAADGRATGGRSSEQSSAGSASAETGTERGGSSGREEPRLGEAGIGSDGDGGASGAAARPPEEAGLESDSGAEQTDAGPSPLELAHDALGTCGAPECGLSYAQLDGDGNRLVAPGPAICLLDALGSRVAGLYTHITGTLDFRGTSATEHLLAVQADGSAFYSSCTKNQGSYYDGQGTAGTTCTGVEHCQLVAPDYFANCVEAMPTSTQEPSDSAWLCLYADPGESWLSSCEPADIPCE